MKADTRKSHAVWGERLSTVLYLLTVLFVLFFLWQSFAGR
jgi:hypothetical protein